MNSINKSSRDQYEEANKSLVESYQLWYEEIKDKTELLEDGYSNPYYIDIPSNWFETELPRILIVGEEGYGDYGVGKSDGVKANDITKIQSIIKEYLEQQLVDDKEHKTKINASSFWRRFRKVAEHGVCCWSNIDKIHSLGKGEGRLTATDRQKLHSLDMRILQREIEILQPNLVIFFGWYGVSLQHELPEVFKKLYPGGLKDRSVWFKSVVKIEHQCVDYLFTYHPTWGYRNAKLGYEDAVMEQIIEILGTKK